MQLIHGDCLIEMASIEDGSIDMVLADPPYGTTACKWDSVIDLDAMWAHLKRVIKPNGAIVMTASQPFTTTLISSNMGMFKYCWVWEKPQGTGFGNAKRQPLRNYEECIVFYEKQSAYNPQFTEGNPYRIKSKSKARVYENGGLNPIETINTGYRYPKQILKFNKDAGKIHPTQKPVALMEYMIKTYTNAGETVLDFTMGSGTTGLACQNLGRDFIGIEMDKTYFDIAQERIEKAQMELLCTI
jgi:DNA modification methylase